MAKSRSRSARKTPISASKAKSKSRPARRPKKRRGIVSLKPLYNEIGRKILELQRIEAGDDRVTQAIKQLEDCRLEFSRLCLPSMDFPIRKALSDTPA